MDIKKEGDIIFVSGDITESCDLSKFDIRQGTAVDFDLGEVRSINSFGVREWISWINRLQLKATYHNCPQSVVMQFNMVKEFLGNHSKVESFLVPAYCENCGEQKNFLMRLGKEFQLGKTPNEDVVKKCDKDGCSIEADVDLESYFYFITDLK